MAAHLPRLGFAAVAALALSSTAQAAVTLTSYTPGPEGVVAGQSVVDSFDAPILAGFTLTGGSVVQGTNGNNYDAPVGDASHYLAVLGQSTATLTTPATISALSVYVGSIDSYNTIAFYDTASQLVSSFTGTDLLAKEGGTADGRFYFDLAGQNIGSVVFGSGSNALELDDIQAAIPEPGAWALLIFGMGALGYALRRRRVTFSAAEA